jgi:hypothetical protein
MVMSMRFFGGKKRETKKQHAKEVIEKGGGKPNAKVARAPASGDAGVSVKVQQPAPGLYRPPSSQRQPPSRQQQQQPPTRQRHQNPVVGANTTLKTQSPAPIKSQTTRPVPQNGPAIEKYYQQKAAQDSIHSASSEDRKAAGNDVTMSTPNINRADNTAVQTKPRSILHTHQQQTRQTAFAMDSPDVHPHNRVRFQSSNDSVASSSCASEVHLMAGPGSVASSSAMSSSRGDAENVFDRVLHSVMTEEEDRLKAMGMSKAASIYGSPGLCPAMYYKSTESSGLYYKGGLRGESSSEDEVSPRNQPVKPIGTTKAAAVGHLIDMRTDGSCKSGNIECEYHDYLDDEAIDANKYRSLLSQRSGTCVSGDSDRALNGSMTLNTPFGRDPRQYQQKPQTQNRK